MTSSDFYTLKGYVLGDFRYFNVPNVQPGEIYCKYLNFSLNGMLRIGFSLELKKVLNEFHRLSETFYLFTRKEGGNLFLITELDNLLVRVQPYLYLNGYLIIEARNFVRRIVGGSYV